MTPGSGPIGDRDQHGGGRSGRRILQLQRGQIAQQRLGRAGHARVQRGTQPFGQRHGVSSAKNAPLLQTPGVAASVSASAICASS